MNDSVTPNLAQDCQTALRFKACEVTMEPNSNSEKRLLVLHELGMVEKRLESIENTIKELTERLSPIMSPQQQREAVDESNTPLEVPLANRLKMLGRGLDNSIEKLESILSRLEI